MRFAAANRVTTISQLATLLSISADAARARARELAKRKLIVLQRFDGRPQTTVFVTAAGQRMVGSPLKAATLTEHHYRHDVGLGWLALAARQGRFGDLRAIVTERQMRSYDARNPTFTPTTNRFAVGLGIRGPTGQPQAHYADLLIQGAGGRVTAIELELSSKSADHLDQVMLAYAGEPRIDDVLYLVASRKVGDPVLAAAARAGLADRVHVQLIGNPNRDESGALIADTTIAPKTSAPSRAARRSTAEREVAVEL